MPELPDITVYIEALEARILNQPLERIRIHSPFLLRSTEPPIEAAIGQTVIELRRVGKRIAIGLDNHLWLVLHLMIAGRLHWRKPGAPVSGRNALAEGLRFGRVVANVIVGVERIDVRLEACGA